MLVSFFIWLMDYFQLLEQRLFYFIILINKTFNLMQEKKKSTFEQRNRSPVICVDFSNDTYWILFPLADACCHGSRVQPLILVVDLCQLISVLLQGSTFPSPHTDEENKKKKEDLKVKK